MANSLVPSDSHALSGDQFIAQWSGSVHRFGLNLWNFEAQVGPKIVEIFRKSFDVKKLNSRTGSFWQQRSSRNHHSNPLMYDTGTLKHSITWKHLGKDGDPSGVDIYTDPGAFGGARRHPGYCYAGVHNADDGETDSQGQLIRRGNVANMPQREFIGDSTYVKDTLEKMTHEIFKGFPQ